MKQDGLTRREKVMTTFAFLPYSLFLQFLHKPYMFPVECLGLRRPHSSILTKGLRIGNLQLLESVALNHFGLLNGHPIATLSLRNCLGAIHLDIKYCVQMENFGFLIGCSLFGFIPAQL